MCTLEDYGSERHPHCGSIASYALDLLDLQVGLEQTRIHHYPDNDHYILFVVESLTEVITYGINLTQDRQKPYRVQEIIRRNNSQN